MTDDNLRDAQVHLARTEASMLMADALEKLEQPASLAAVEQATSLLEKAVAVLEQHGDSEGAEVIRGGSLREAKQILTRYE